MEEQEGTNVKSRNTFIDEIDFNSDSGEGELGASTEEVTNVYANIELSISAENTSNTHSIIEDLPQGIDDIQANFQGVAHKKYHCVEKEQNERKIPTQNHNKQKLTYILYSERT